MGYKKSYDMNRMNHDLHVMSYEINSAYNDGFVAFGIKQDLYKIKWLVDALLSHCHHFAGENEWLKEKKQEKIIEILKR